MALGMWRIAGHALMSKACDTIPHHVHPVSSVVFCGLPTSSLDTPHKSCDNGKQAIEDTPDDPTCTTHHAGFRRAGVCLVTRPWTRMRDSPREERRNYG
jgi:hypothetical protein